METYVRSRRVNIPRQQNEPVRERKKQDEQQQNVLV
jgi:hypothetical protein